MKMIQSGVNSTAAKRISRHLTDSVFERYNIIMEVRLHEASRKQDAVIEEQRRKAASTAVAVTAEIVRPASPKAGTMHRQNVDASSMQILGSDK